MLLDKRHNILTLIAFFFHKKEKSQVRTLVTQPFRLDKNVIKQRANGDLYLRKIIFLKENANNHIKHL